MKTLPRRTVGQLMEDGIDITDKLLIMVDDKHYAFKKGALLILDVNDGSDMPYFRLDEDGDGAYVNMDRLAIYDPTNLEHIAFRTKLRLTG